MIVEDAVESKSTSNSRWTLAEVRANNASEDGTPAFFPTEQTVWAEASQVLGKVESISQAQRPTTGDRFTITGFDETKPRNSGRFVLPKEAKISSDQEDGSWVILVQDAKTRSRTHYHFALGLRGDQTPVPLEPGVWASFQEKLKGSDDRRPDKKKDLKAKIEPVDFSGLYGPGKPKRSKLKKSLKIGSRRVLNQYLDGAVLWVQITDKGGTKQITDISASAVWRYKGAHSAKERLPDWQGADDTEDARSEANQPPKSSHLACEDPDFLCPSCRVFGMVDNSGRKQDSEQYSYASHVRFLSAKGDHQEYSEAKWLNVLSSPNPIMA
jgi:hypothetical protein